MLFDFGRPDISAADNEGRTPLDIATRSNNESLVKFLLKHA
jgi:ankyrin repeat protein